MFQTLLYFFIFILSNIYSCGTLTITRYILQGQDSDHFSYTDDAICGTNEERHKWCGGKKASLAAELRNFGYRCSCLCKNNFKTFLIEKGECVNESYLGSLPGFNSDGKYLFSTNNINLQIASSNFPTDNRCKNCIVHKVYFRKSGNWHEMPNSGSELWSINVNGVLTWPALTNWKNASGRILKIQLMNCTKNKNDICGKWGSKNPIMFCKSLGNYSVIISVTSPPSTLAPTPTLIKSESQRMSSSEQTKATAYATRTQLASTSPTTDNVIINLSTSHPAILAPTPTLIKSESQRMSPSEQTKATAYTTRTEIPQRVSTSISLISSTTAIIHHPSTAQPRSNSLSDEVPTPIAAIVGSVVACGVVLGIIVFYFVWKRRKKNSRQRPHDNAKVPPDSTGNPMYGQNQGDVIALPSRKCQDSLGTGAEEYDYAAVDGVPSNHQKPTTPIYQSLIKENVRTSVYAPLNKETPVQYSYNHLQHPQYNPPRSKSDPLYNTLGKPNGDVYMEPGTQITDNKPKASEPLYNVLEGPDGNPAPRDNDPVYNVLEDPDANQYPQDNDPVYNVLEDPDADPHPQDNDPVYNVLEDPDDDYDNAPSDDDQNLPASGQDNVAYSSTIDLKMPQAPSSPDYDVLEDPDGALSDSTYQPLGVRVQDDVYQPLDRTSQSIYQSLEPNDSTA